MDKYLEISSSNLQHRFQSELQKTRNTVQKFYFSSERKSEAEVSMSKFASFLDEFLDNFFIPHVKVTRHFNYNVDREFILETLRIINNYKRLGISEALKKLYPGWFEKRNSIFSKPVFTSSLVKCLVDAAKYITSTGNSVDKTVIDYLVRNEVSFEAFIEGAYDNLILDKIGANTFIVFKSRIKKYQGEQSEEELDQPVKMPVVTSGAGWITNAEPIMPIKSVSYGEAMVKAQEKTRRNSYSLIVNYDDKKESGF